MPRQDLIRCRRGTAAEWAAANPVLAAGEPGFETDTEVMKLGDGASPWTALPSRLPVVISAIDPGLTTPGLWVQTGLGTNGDQFTIWVEDGT